MSASCEPTFLTYSQCDEVTIKVATTRDERQGAFRLAYQSYLRAGLCVPCGVGLRMTPYQLHGATDIIIAELRGEVISTLSLVRDSELGLPLESIYPEEVEQRRASGLRLAEVSCLADRRREATRFFDLFSELARIMIQMADRGGVDQLLIAVHPRHARMYCRAMAFEKVAPDRGYPAVNGHPAVMLSLGMKYLRTERVDVWRRFARDPLPESIVGRRPICDVDRWYFEKLARSIDGADDGTRPQSFVAADNLAHAALACA